MKEYVKSKNTAYLGGFLLVICMTSILTGVITGVITLAVCLINNAVQLKRDRNAREQAQNEQLDALRRDMTSQINEIRSDFMAHMQELIATQQDITTKMQLFGYQLENLGKNVEKHNQVVERTYSLERRMDLAEEKQRVANNRIDDLEDENKKKQS